MSEDETRSMADLSEQLKAPLPDEAYETDTSRGFPLTGIKGAYVTERLNQVFGLCGWGWRLGIAELNVADDWVTAMVNLSYHLGDGWSECIPSAGEQRIVKGRVGDAMKGAVTDALKKAASFLGVGHRAYKGLLTPPTGLKRSPPPPPSKTKHWLDRPDARKAFWAWAKGVMQLTEDQIHEALQVKSVRDFEGTMAMAKLAIEAYAIDEEDA